MARQVSMAIMGPEGEGDEGFCVDLVRRARRPRSAGERAMRAAVSIAALLGVALLAAGCSNPARFGAPAAAPAPARAAASKRIVSDGTGGLVLPDGTRVQLDQSGGFTLPNGAYVRRDRSGALNLPNGARCVPDGQGGYGCP